jgi:hypothetical protein
LGVVAVTPLVVLQLLAGGAGAADTREIYLGSGPVGDPETNGTLTLTPVTVGGVTSTNVIVKNIDNQTLTHVVVTVAAPTGGLTMTGVFGADAGDCSTDFPPLVCDFGNLAKNQSRTFTVLFSASSATASTVTATVQFNESTTPNGSNTHVEPATGSVTPTDGGCDLTSTFLPPGQLAKVVGTSCDLSATNPQTTSVVVPASVVSAIRVAEEASNACKSGLVCFGQASVADVAVDGTYTVVWTIQWQVASNFIKNKFGILHFPDGSDTSDLTLTYKKDLCKTAGQVGCIESLTLSGTTLTAVVRTSGNGKMRGFS